MSRKDSYIVICTWYAYDLNTWTVYDMYIYWDETHRVYVKYCKWVNDVLNMWYHESGLICKWYYASCIKCMTLKQILCESVV